MDAVAYTLLARALVAAHGRDSKLAHALGRDSKGLASLGLYTAAIPLAFVHPSISYAVFVFVALLWLVPDRRFERHQADEAATRAQ
jgi:hypothetical protein